VYLPRWSSKVKVWAPLLAWWRKLMTLMKTHESGHVAISARAADVFPGVEQLQRTHKRRQRGAGGLRQGSVLDRGVSRSARLTVRAADRRAEPPHRPG
jgi:hypothetical protein